MERARFNMIEQQIRPWDVLDPDVLALLTVVKREEFVPPQYRGLAFSDLEIPLTPAGVPAGESMFAPKVEARVLQELALRHHESVLEIGAGSGHMAALLAHRARDVVTAEINPELQRMAADNLRRAGVANARVHAGNGLDLVRGRARFDVIVLSGSVQVIPEEVTAALNVGGRLFAVVGQLPVMHARVITRTAETSLATTGVFETVAPPLIGFPQPSRFRF